MKVKVRKHKKSPAPVATEQAMGTSAITNLKNTFIGYGIPRKVLFDKG